ncbi:MAG: response regulator [Chloroflexi bacterium]|nr:response regulator [Chloroflexota bacterium]
MPRRVRRHALVIDRSPDLPAFMSMLLASDGYRVATASSALEARVELVTVRPDLVIADIDMPGLPLRGLLDLCRRDEKLRDVPVLVCTASARPEIVDTIAACAGVGVLPTPFDVDELLTRTASLINGAR